MSILAKMNEKSPDTSGRFDQRGEISVVSGDGVKGKDHRASL
jgi:hypothetical protein